MKHPFNFVSKSTTASKCYKLRLTKYFLRKTCFGEICKITIYWQHHNNSDKYFINATYDLKLYTLHVVNRITLIIIQYYT